MLDRFFHPLIAIEEEKIPCEVAGRAQFGGVRGIQLIRREHLSYHLIVRRVRIECLYHPVAPVPDVFLAVTQFIAKAPPITVAPHVHPVARPTLAVARIIQQPVH